MGTEVEASGAAMGVRIGTLPSGALNSITDVKGVRVGHCTVSRDVPEIVRTGVTVVYPLEVDYLEGSVFAGLHRYNGFGEFCGAHWIAETGILTSPIFLTSSYSVGVVRDTLMMDPVHRGQKRRFHHPCIAETNDGFLNGWSGGYITPEHVHAAMAQATSGVVAQGAVGGGTGMACYGFKGGIGSASRIAATAIGEVTVGVLVQTNHGQRADLTIAGHPVGRCLGPDVIPSPKRPDDGSIVILIACDAPLTPAQCQRLAQRAVVGLGRTGGFGHNSSGDFVLAFSTGNRIPAISLQILEGLRMFPNEHISPLFAAVAEATEAAIVNSMLCATDTTGRNGTKIWALDTERLLAAISRCRSTTP